MRYTVLIFFVISFSKTPAQHVIDQTALDSLLRGCKESHSESLTVLLHGKLVIDYSLHETQKPVACYSVLKSIASLAVGKLMADGKITSIDQPVSDFYPEWKQGITKEVTIKHLLNHTSGLEFDERDIDFYKSNDLVRSALSSKIVDTPGTKFLYNTKAFLLLLGVIGKATGIKTDKFIEQSFFIPLGIKNYKWDYDAAGNVKELFSSSFELVKIGQLVLNGGSWKGRQLISKDWINKLVQPSQPFVPDNGFLWWLIPETIVYIVDDALLEEFKKAGIKQDIIDRFKLLKGEYVNVNISPDKLKTVFGEDWQSFLNKEFYPYFPVRSRRKYGSRIIGYKAEGYLGQYIVIYPEKKLVAARMVNNTDQYKIETDEMLDFPAYVYKLVK